jgi:hypothetical protein
VLVLQQADQHAHRDRNRHGEREREGTLRGGGDDETDGRAREHRAVTFITTEHFTLQGARAATIAESAGRATMFLTSVTGGLVALGLVATASRVGTAFYAFGLALLPTLTLIGLVTFERALQSGIEDYGYARRIALLRSYYFENAPELTPYLLSVPPPERLHVQGLWASRAQGLRTVAGMIGVITARPRADLRGSRDRRSMVRCRLPRSSPSPRAPLRRHTRFGRRRRSRCAEGPARRRWVP